MMSTPEEVLAFWFDEVGRTRWFEATPEVDRLVCEQLGPLHEQAARGELDAWRDTIEGALALCILLDQAPRNMFRGTETAFATDEVARDVAQHALDLDFDRDLDPDRKLILYLPFMHSEDLVDQERCVALCEAAGLDKPAEYARGHAQLINRFGRFPHRNTALGRASSQEEVAWLRDHEGGFGQG
jgi:uncharacterized protein (DUF924 family)